MLVLAPIRQAGRNTYQTTCPDNHQRCLGTSTRSTLDPGRENGSAAPGEYAYVDLSRLPKSRKRGRKTLLKSCHGDETNSAPCEREVESAVNLGPEAPASRRSKLSQEMVARHANVSAT
jgi:hypothetical protein